MPRIGSGLVVIGRANPNGLGYMTCDFCTEMEPDHIILIDTCNHAELPFHPEWFDGLVETQTLKVVKASDWKRSGALIHGMLEQLAADKSAPVRAVVGFETFYSGQVVASAKLLGLKTIAFPMWECSPPDICHADRLICLSKQDAECYPHGRRCQWPVSDSVTNCDDSPKWPPKVFLHNAGHSDHGRNGTREVLAAAKWLNGTGATLLVRSQFEIPADWIPDESRQNIKFMPAVAEHRHQLYAFGDVFVHPMQFAGLSLPLNEAAANCLPTIVLDLPEWKDWPYRVSVASTHRARFARPVIMRRACPVELGNLMRSMALGNVPLALPPTPPTWRQFREWWPKLIGDEVPV